MGRRRLPESPSTGGAIAPLPNGHARETALLARIEALERELRESRENEARFRSVAEQATDVISHHLPNGVCTYVSPAVTRVLGYAPDELIGHTSRDTIHPDDLPAFVSEMEALRSGGGSAMIRYRALHRRTGDYVWVETNLRAIHDQDGALTGFHAIARDITARKRGEDALREGEARFRLLAEHATDVISRTTPDGRIIYVSPSCATVLGYAPEELFGRFAQDLIEPDDLADATAARQALLTADETGPAIRRLRHKDGHSVWAETTRHALRDAATDEVVEVHAVTRDVTVRIRAEEQARELATMKSDFVALVSHELRAPLTNMMGSIELLEHESSSVPAGARRTLALLASQTERLRHLVETILDLSRMDAGQLPLTLGPVPVNIAVARALETLPSSARSGVAMRAQADLPFAWADETYLTQVIANVLSNAVKYGAPPIALEAQIASSTIVIAVTDAGRGLETTDRDRLFEPFFRGSAGSAGQRGYGLGLYFARRLLEAQHGTISVESPLSANPGAPGARFIIRIPAADGGL